MVTLFTDGDFGHDSLRILYTLRESLYSLMGILVTISCNYLGGSRL